jgi:hypothetical protein
MNRHRETFQLDAGLGTAVADGIEDVIVERGRGGYVGEEIVSTARGDSGVVTVYAHSSVSCGFTSILSSGLVMGCENSQPALRHSSWTTVSQKPSRLISNSM